MIYENITYEDIIKRILERIPEDLDKREGSVIYDAIAPIAVELKLIYMELDNIMKLTFAETSYGEFLDRRVNEMGIERRKALKARRKAYFYGADNEAFNIQIGNRFNIENLNFTAVEKISDGVFILECESPGRCGNQVFGSLIPIDYIEGLTRADIKGSESIKIPGEEEETDKELLERYKKYITNKIQDGNIAQYEEWCENEDGIGAYKIIPLWNGANTVKASICNSNGRKASAELLKSFQNKLDPEGKGLGNGLAPIGAIVTVSSGSEINIPVNCRITAAEGYSYEEVYDCIEDKIGEYFKSIVYKKSKISYLQLASVISNIIGIDTVKELYICGQKLDIDISGERIPVLRSKRLGDEVNDLILYIEGENID